MADAERITVPEYLALVHYQNANASDDADQAPPSVDDVNDMFLMMERAGIARLN